VTARPKLKTRERLILKTGYFVKAPVSLYPQTSNPTKLLSKKKKVNLFLRTQKSISNRLGWLHFGLNIIFWKTNY